MYLLDALVRLVVELAVYRFSFTVDQLEGVGAIAIHVPVAVWGATVREQEGYLMGGFRAQSDEVPEHVCILSSFIAMSVNRK